MSIESRLSKINAISFDGDMTLWDFETLMRRALGHTLAELRAHFPGPAADSLTVERMIEIRNDVAAELKGTTVNLEEIRLRAFHRTIEYVGCKDTSLADHLNTVYRERRFQDVELYPDVLPTLDALDSRYSLGLLSNGNSYPKRVGLEDRFSLLCSRRTRALRNRISGSSVRPFDGLAVSHRRFCTWVTLWSAMLSERWVAAPCPYG